MGMGSQPIRWRAVAGWFFLLFGLGMLVLSPVFGLFLIREMWSVGSAPLIRTGITYAIFLFLIGVLWTISGVAFFQGNWKLAVPTAVLGWILGAVGNYMLEV